MRIRPMMIEHDGVPPCSGLTHMRNENDLWVQHCCPSRIGRQSHLPIGGRNGRDRLGGNSRVFRKLATRDFNIPHNRMHELYRHRTPNWHDVKLIRGQELSQGRMLDQFRARGLPK